MVSPKSVHQRSFGRLGVLTVSGETLHATDSAHRPTQMDLRRMCARYIKRNAQTRRFWTRHSMVSCSRFPHFHFQKLHLTVTRTLSNDVKEFCFTTQLLYVTHRQSPIRADEENVVTESHIQRDTVLTKNDRDRCSNSPPDCPAQRRTDHQSGPSPFHYLPQLSTVSQAGHQI